MKTLISYKDSYALVGFDADFRYLGVTKEGHTRPDIKFKSYLKDPVTVIYATFSETVEIDEARNVKIEDLKK